MMDRRQFVQACAVLLGSNLLIAGCGSGSSGGSGNGSSITGLSKSRWMELPSTQFSVAHETYGAIDMQLTSIEDEIYSPEVEQFSVTLTGPDNPLFDEGKYEMYNESLGYVELYLQQGDNSQGKQVYRAVFSLLEA
jgi:hypothetical protein